MIYSMENISEISASKHSLFIPLECYFNFPGPPPYCKLGFPGGLAGKESACNTGDPGSIPGLGRSAGEG